MERHGVICNQEQPLRVQERDWRDAPESQSPVSADHTEEISRHFRETYPIMLDGALPRPDDRVTFIHQARQTLRRVHGDPHRLPGAILRETLNRLVADPRPTTQAGLVAAGPQYARVWWDEAVLDNLDDVLSQLDSPRLVLRFYDVTGLEPDGGRWHDTFDIDVDIHEKGRTVHFWAGDRMYAVDLGYVYADGRFLRLARTNTVVLPREGQGEAGDGRTARSSLKARGDRYAPYVGPDKAAQEWALALPDDENRDIEAELIIHMLYRAFLEEGPRALRRAPCFVRREAGILRREFLQRERVRERAIGIPRKSAPVFLVTRLDGGQAEVAARESVYQMIPAARFGLGFGAHFAGLTGDSFAWYRQLLQAARSGLETRRAVSVTRVDAEEEKELVVSPFRRELRLTPSTAMAVPVFEAAEHLRESLAGLRPLDGPVVGDIGALSTGKRVFAHESIEDDEPLRVFGGAECKRMAKAGVRVTRMALTLEGKMRPGARLKVAGKLVHADKDGKFRLECVLSGRRASIPMRAGLSIGGEARSLINVEWEKRPARGHAKTGVSS